MTLVLFDLDDSLIAGDSERAWVEYMNQNSLIKGKSYLKIISEFENDYRRGELDINSYVKFLLNPVKGISEDFVINLSKLFAKEIVNLYKDTLTKELLAKHESHVCIIVSGTLSFLVKEIASLLGIKNYFGTEPEIIKGFFTGNPLGEPNFGREKVRKIKEWMISNQLDLDQEIYVYSDSIFDLPLLDLATIPTAISPDKKLRKVCSERSWKVIERNIL